jgi:hypothetical protein
LGCWKNYEVEPLPETSAICVYFTDDEYFDRLYTTQTIQYNTCNQPVSRNLRSLGRCYVHFLTNGDTVRFIYFDLGNHFYYMSGVQIINFTGINSSLTQPKCLPFKNYEELSGEDQAKLSQKEKKRLKQYHYESQVVQNRFEAHNVGKRRKVLRKTK